MEEIAYLRKANALQGYFETKYDLKDCQYIEITDEMLDNLGSRLNGTISILEKYAKDKDSLKALKEFENGDYCGDYLDDIEEKLKDYHEQKDKVDAELKLACHKGKAFYPQDGFFYGDVDILDFISWQLPQIKTAIEAVAKAYDKLKDDKHILYYSWW